MINKNKINHALVYSWLICLIVYRLLIAFSYKYELTNGESNNVWKAINVASGEKLYNDPEKLPLDVFQYAPISELPILLFAKISNPESPQYVYSITLLGRLYQILCNIILGILLFKISKQLFKFNKLNALFITLTSITLLTPTAFTIRPDATALMFLFFTIYSYLKCIKNDYPIKGIIITSSLIVLNFFCKQDGIFIAIPIAIHLVMQKKWIELLKTVVFSTSFLILTFLLMYSYFGSLFFINTILGLKNTTSISQMITIFDRAYSIYGIIMTLGILTTGFYCYRIKNVKINFIGIIGVFYFMLALVLSLKIGSWINYYTPFLIISIFTCSYFYHTQLILKTNFSSINLLFTFIAMIFMFHQLYNYTAPLILKSYHQEYNREYLACKKLNLHLKLTKNEHIIIPNQLDRNFFAKNSVMVNSEYYNQASYKYKQFRSKRNKNIKYIVFKNNENETIDFLTNYFNIDLKHYTYNKINQFNVYQYKN